MFLTNKDKIRFESKIKRSVDPDGCDEWLDYKNKEGRGRLRVGCSKEQAARVAWTIENGDIPDGMLVLHECDNTGCVKVKHLFLGTHQDNATDKVNKGRQANGERIGWGKLTQVDVEAIRELELKGFPKQKSADFFGVSLTLIYKTIARETWSHV